MQLWNWEWCPSLRPKKPNSLRPGEPRAAVWSKLSTNMSIELVRLVMSSPKNFQLQTFGHCFWVSELTGLGNQDIPGHFGLPKESCRDPIKPAVINLIFDRNYLIHSSSGCRSDQFYI
ncbi:hypothetical protein NE237_009480 [Protea cynaroides]|uniref:Uncharacterized protein n=1 Tax=Protea cynaroides TaxID=273540 RepID=A0A9Q0R0B8_9MAGN|nr:hypothetical protein NE237_009480 [Protea cynaroides]